jgi:hypothetical protein
MTTPLSIVLSTPKGVHRVGQPVAVAVAVCNVSESPVQIVGVLDGSETGVRFPHYLPEIKSSVEFEPPEMEVCGTAAPLRITDFRLLLPKDCFDPAKSAGEASYLPLFTFNNFRPSRAGVYELSLTLSTASERDEQWLGVTGYPGEEKVLELLKEVPRLTVESNVLIVKVEA